MKKLTDVEEAARSLVGCRRIPPDDRFVTCAISLASPTSLHECPGKRIFRRQVLFQNFLLKANMWCEWYGCKGVRCNKRQTRLIINVKWHIFSKKVCANKPAKGRLSMEAFKEFQPNSGTVCLEPYICIIGNAGFLHRWMMMMIRRSNLAGMAVSSSVVWCHTHWLILATFRQARDDPDNPYLLNCQPVRWFLLFMKVKLSP